MTKENPEGPQDNAAEIALSWETFPGKGPDGIFRYSAGETEVSISDIQDGRNEDTCWVDIWTGSGGGSPSFRVSNPSVLVSDSSGDIVFHETDERGRTRTYRFRKDPIHAVVQVLARVRGAR